MTKEERAELAVQYKQSGYNCCQSVIKAYEDCIPADESLLMQLGAGFAAGMGCMEATCGALTGAVMAAGVRRAGEMVPWQNKYLLSLSVHAVPRCARSLRELTPVLCCVRAISAYATQYLQRNQCCNMFRTP